MSLRRNRPNLVIQSASSRCVSCPPSKLHVSAHLLHQELVLQPALLHTRPAHHHPQSFCLMHALPAAMHCPAHLLYQELGCHKAGQAKGEVQVQVVEGAAGHRQVTLISTGHSNQYRSFKSALVTLISSGHKDQTGESASVPGGQVARELPGHFYHQSLSTRAP